MFHSGGIGALQETQEGLKVPEHQKWNEDIKENNRKTEESINHLHAQALEKR